MIAMYIIQGDPECIGKKSQIFRREISTGNDQFHSCETLRLEAILEEWFHII
jgi:hypothetical protein